MKHVKYLLIGLCLIAAFAVLVGSLTFLVMRYPDEAALTMGGFVVVFMLGLAYMVGLIVALEVRLKKERQSREYRRPTKWTKP